MVVDMMLLMEWIEYNARDDIVLFVSLQVDNMKVLIRMFLGEEFCGVVVVRISSVMSVG